MVQGLRVVFSPNPASRMLYSDPVPESGARGTVTAARTPSGRTRWFWKWWRHPGLRSVRTT